MTSIRAMRFETSTRIYVARRLIGEGGAGRVFVATDGDREVAIKVLSAAKASGPSRQRFINELHFGLRNTHPNIITILDHGVLPQSKGPSLPFYVMPRYDCSLRQPLTSAIPPDIALTCLSRMLDGVEAAHLRTVVHRDLKPENILLSSSWSELVVADFGIARFLEEALIAHVQTRPGERLANFQYAAPEQRVRGAQIDERADIFALGCILNEMFTRQVPQGSGYTTIGSVSKQHEYLDEVVEKMIRQNPEERYRSIGQVKEALIARQTEHIARQRLSEIEHTVVPVGTIDDPLVVNPVSVVGADYRSGRLILQLSQPVTAKWVAAFKNMGSHQSVLNAGPEHFRFSQTEASVAVPERNVQRVLDFFKDWLPNVTQRYRRMLEEEAAREEAQLRDRLRREQEEEERRLRVLRGLKL